MYDPLKNSRKSIENPKYLGCKPQPLKGLLMTLNAYAVSATPYGKFIDNPEAVSSISQEGLLMTPKNLESIDLGHRSIDLNT